VSRRSRVALVIGGSVLGLAVILIAVVISVARSAWFREQVRQRIVAEAEKATGGRVEIGSFSLDWHTLTVRLSDFAIHGLEPRGSPPLLRVRSITVVLRVISFLERTVNVQSVDVDRPQSYLLIFPDGTTNVPQPKTPRASVKNPAETILDLKVGRFTVQNGTAEFNSHRMPWNASGENLRAQFLYNHAAPSYSGEFSIQPLHLRISKDLPADLGLKVALTVEKNKITISSARFETSQSSADLSGTMRDFSSPEYLFQYNLRLSANEFVRTLRFRARAEGTMLLSGDASFRDFGHYLITGNLRAASLSVSQDNFRLRDVRAESAFRADPQQIDLSGLRLWALDGVLTGRARVEKLDQFRLQGELSRFSLRRLAGFTGSPGLPWDGLVSGPLEMTGLVSDLSEGRFKSRARLKISPAPHSPPVEGLIDAAYDGRHRDLNLGNSFLQLPSTRLDFAGAPARQMRVKLASTNLDDLLPAMRMFAASAPPTLPLSLQNGSAAFDGTITGGLTSPQIAGRAVVKNFKYSNESIDSLAADVAVRKSELRVDNGTLARGNLRAQFAGSVGLRDWKPDTAGPLTVNASLRQAAIGDLFALAGIQNSPASGTVAATTRISGSVGAPTIKSDVTVDRGSLYGEPFDRLTAHVDSPDGRVTVATVQVTAAGNHLNANATYTHSPNDFQEGQLAFQASSNRMLLNQFHLARLTQLSIAGGVQFTAKGSVTISGSHAPMFRLTDLNADVDGQDMQLAQQPVGAVHLTLASQGSVLTAHLETSIANSAIRADGRWNLTDDYPGSAQVTFTKVDIASLKSWLPLPVSSLKLAGSLEGKVTISGPALKPEAWTADLEVPGLEISTAGSTGARTFAFHNQQPVRLKLQNSVVRVQSAHLIGETTDLSITGTISLKDRNPLDLQLDGHLDLATLAQFNSDVVSSGKLIAAAAIRGPLTQPAVTGRVELQNTNLSFSTFPNGLSNASGVIVFTGNRATIEKLTGESGGGKLSVTGFASYVGGDTAFQVELAADQMRVRYPEGVSTIADAKLTWAGTSQRNLVSGNITILRTGFNPRADFGSILASSAQPFRTPAAHTGLLGGMNLDIQIETSSNIQVQSALAQQVQAEATLRLRGTAVNPALLGRINITQGQLSVFGNKYTINQGSVSFLNPVKIEPIVNIDIQTRARGVDITLNISGPMSKLNVTYRSDPPLQFSDIVALLATGRAPASDPSMAARESEAALSWQQMGASALVGQAISSPSSSGRLQRFFGVSNIKIDPTTVTGSYSSPQARLSIEQQVSPNITFTYITNVNQTNPQIIQVEWALNRKWSVVALRDENGLFGMDVYFKKRF
jgi:translocation and assembly module TamB